MVIRDCGVVDEARAKRALEGARGDHRAVRFGNRTDDRGERLGDRARELAAVGARIAEELAPLVKRLRDVERPLRAHAEEAVGMALKLGEIVEQRGWQRSLGALDGLHPRLAAFHTRDDARRLFAVLGQAPHVAAKP